MSVAVGYLAGKGGRSPLFLAVEAAKTLKTSLTVVTVVPRPWMTPSIARIDAEYAQYAEQLAADSAKEAQECIASIGDGVKVDFRKVAHRSASGGLLEAADELKAEALVLGSAADGKLGQVVVGSTADRLLHSSPVPLAISPRGYRGSRTGRLSRLTCAYPGTPECITVVERVAALAERLGVPMRVITFAVRGRTMYPSQVGLRVEDS
ncbi:MAG TPA: universal stress protein, partial [Mycobacterium sp.]